MSQLHTDALIIGGGLAGSMVALELARAGRQPVLLERTAQAHNKVCGEFLSGEAIHYLARHNVDLQAMGAVPLRTIRLKFKRTTMEAELPFTASSLTRSVLDQELLKHAALAGVDVHRNAQVEKLQQHNGVWAAGLRDETHVYAKHAFLATGKHDLRGWPRPAGKHRGLTAFKMYFRLSAQQHRALGQAVELILFDGGYAGLQPVEDGCANLCFLVTAKHLHQGGGRWTELLPHLMAHAPQLAERLDGATPLLDAPLAASHIPYGHMQTTSDNLWRVGDQAAVIPSFCGDGMAIALHSGAMAAHHFLRGNTPETYRRELRRQLARRLAFATRLSQLIVSVPQIALTLRFTPSLLSSIAAITRIPAGALLA